MSEDWMLKTLVGLGLKEVEAEVYVFLAKNGPYEAIDIATSLKLSRQQLYRCLKNLQIKNVVTASTERPFRFSAVIFEKVLDLFLKAKITQQQILQESKEELLSTWRSITEKDSAKS